MQIDHSKQNHITRTEEKDHQEEYIKENLQILVIIGNIVV